MTIDSNGFFDKIKRLNIPHSVSFSAASDVASTIDSCLSVSLAKYVYEHFIKSPVLYSAKETVERARSHIGEGGYNLITHNCEHFAIYCKPGIYDSEQVEEFIKIIFMNSQYTVH